VAAFSEATLDAFETACASFAVGDIISATWCDRPGCDDYDPTPVTWVGTVVAAWSPLQRNLSMRWDKHRCPRLVGATLASFPPWDLPCDEALFALPVRLATVRRNAPYTPATPRAPAPAPPPPFVEHKDDDSGSAFADESGRPDGHSHDEPGCGPGGDPDDEPADFQTLVDFWTAREGTFPDEALRPFRCGNGSLPAVAALRGSDLVFLLSQPTPPVPTLVATGLVATTRAEHARTLRLLASLPASLHPLPISTAIITFCESLAKERGWRHSTRLKRLATAQGALALLPTYRTAPAIQLSSCPSWRQAMRAAGIAAPTEGALFQAVVDTAERSADLCTRRGAFEQGAPAAAEPPLGALEVA
jgi:hypothetical protein